MKQALVYKKKRNTFRFFKRHVDGEDKIADPEAERLKQQWLQEHAITVLPPGFSRYGYQ